MRSYLKCVGNQVLLCSIALALNLSQSAFAASYPDSQQHAERIRELTTAPNGSLFVDLMDKLISTTGACVGSAALTGAAFALDTVPFTGVRTTAGKLTASAGRMLLVSVRTLKIQDVPVFVSFLNALAPIASSLSKISTSELKTFIQHAVPFLATESAQAQRVLGVILGYHATRPDNVKDTVDFFSALGIKELRRAIDTYAPHIMGGAVTALLDNKIWSTLTLDGRQSEKGVLVKEAYRSSIIAKDELFSENASCRMNLTDVSSALDEILMRSNMKPRPKAEAETPNGHPLASDSGSAQPRGARTDNEAENGGPYLEPVRNARQAAASAEPR